VIARIRPLEPNDASACDDIVLGLPYHFGNDAGRAQCAEAVRSQAGFVAEDAGEVLGFVTLEDRFDDVVEITWMAVRAERRRQGIGRLLLDRVAERALAGGRRLLIVLTVSPSDGPDDVDDGYEATRGFYEANGFVLTRDLPGYWGSDTPVLMTRVL
jgi:ribosomal protein S18 acetylase RimI-like enzyme